MPMTSADEWLKEFDSCDCFDDPGEKLIEAANLIEHQQSLLQRAVEVLREMRVPGQCKNVVMPLHTFENCGCKLRPKCIGCDCGDWEMEGVDVAALLRDMTEGGEKT